VNKTVKKYSYYLRYNCDVDAIGFDAQANGCEFYTSYDQIVITMWETNPYNSWFVLKYSKDFAKIKTEDWYI
jgi:hypothetical protein